MIAAFRGCSIAVPPRFMPLNTCSSFLCTVLILYILVYHGTISSAKPQCQAYDPKEAETSICSAFVSTQVDT
jgi:hypothetical protein